MTTAVPVRFLDRSTPPHIGTLIVLAGLSAMSMNIFLPSLPDMAAHFGTDYSVMQLSVAVYLATNAVLQIIVGPISDRYGRRPVLLWSTAAFLVVTLGCIYAPTIEIFLAFRMAQAVIVAGMVLSRAVVRDILPQNQAASMIGYVTMGMALVPMFAPAIGGFLGEIYGWQSNFWAMFLIGCLTLWLVWGDLGETAARSTSSLAEQVRQYPELFMSRRFWGYCLTAAFSSGAFFAYLGGAPYVGSIVFGLEPATMGIFFGAPAFGYMTGNFLSGRYSARIGINPMILWGTILVVCGPALSMLLFRGGADSPFAFFAPMVLVGLGSGLVMPNSTSGMLSVRPHLAGTASGLGGSIMIAGGAALSALAGALLVPGAGAYPLLWIMIATAAAAVVSILYTIRRERQISAS